MFFPTWFFVVIVVLAHPLTWALAGVFGAVGLLYLVRKLKGTKGK